MVRSYWKGALVVALAWVSAADGQQPVSSSAPPGQTPERLMTVHEPGKPPQICRVLGSRTLPGGGTAYTVQSLSSGETSTIVEGSDSPTAGVRPAGGQSISISVEGQKPETEKLQPVPSGAPATPPAPTATGPGGRDGGVHGDGCEYRTIQEPGQPAHRCRLLRRWRMSPNAYACELQCVDN